MVKHSLHINWGYYANNMWSDGWSKVDDRPQNTTSKSFTVRQQVQNIQLSHSFVADFTSSFPQAIRLQLPQIWSLFSPLSTQPITTTTNLKTKKG